MANFKHRIFITVSEYWKSNITLKLSLPDEIHEEKPSFLQLKKKNALPTDGWTDGRSDLIEMRMPHLIMNFADFCFQKFVYLQIKKNVCMQIRISNKKSWKLLKIIENRWEWIEMAKNYKNGQNGQSSQDSQKKSWNDKK